MEHRYSVSLDRARCNGCTHCMRVCPTQAIRVRGGHANILEDRCIDCGMCISICPRHAKKADTDPISRIHDYRYPIALPGPEFFGQFAGLKKPETLMQGLLGVGFADCCEVSLGADILSVRQRQLLERSSRFPLISASCPAVTELIRRDFPDLLPHILPVEPMEEIAARIARREFARKTGAEPEEIGIFYITPCPARATRKALHTGMERSNIDAVLSVMDVYGLLSAYKQPQEVNMISRASYSGLYWSIIGGESRALGEKESLAVDGIHDVIQVLEALEDGKFPELRFFEPMACKGGCVGGCLNFENPFVAQNRVRQLMEGAPRATMTSDEADALLEGDSVLLTRPVTEIPPQPLDDSFTEAMKKMARINRLTAAFPGLDCGSCGSPTCALLAEDVVRGNATELDCIFRLRQKMREYTKNDKS
ncbi:MAG: [Fe-Fe] hydrogenase large subunit C-terminal domain-containing protein [Christensenellales bacterium]|jgi:iron only hydrogenase large subunit-like protein